MKKAIGYNVDYFPKNAESTDKKCPYTGSTSIRGKMFEGTVVSDSMKRTVKVEWDNLIKDTKFNRYYKKRTRVAAHNPDVISAKKGDKVLIAETKPLSKTKHFTVLKVINENESN